MENYIGSLVVLAITGGIAALVLGIASRLFHVEEDKTLAAVEDALPSVNCGGCGYAGCTQYAIAIINDKEDITLCAPGGNDAIQLIAELTGQDATIKEPERAVIACSGSENNCITRYQYKGLTTCQAAHTTVGGFKNCTYGCLGFADCKDVCMFNAIVKKDDIVVVIPEKCTGCGACVHVCPRNVIGMIPKKQKAVLVCNSPEKGAKVNRVCSTGCTACTLCVKKCPHDALVMEDNKPKWDYSKCVNCKICSQVCPKNAIHWNGVPLKKPKVVKKVVAE